MIKIVYTTVLLSSLILSSCSCGPAPVGANEIDKELMAPKSQITNKKEEMDKNFHDFTVKNIEGKDYDLAQLKGKKVLVVNTASACGLTPQFKQMQELYEEYGGENFELIGFPSDNFAGQEPLDNDGVADFCQKNYGVTFPMMAKVDVKGSDAIPLYQWLISEEIRLNGNEDFQPEWNFHKFLIDEEGNYVKQIAPGTLPTDETIIEWLEK